MQLIFDFPLNPHYGFDNFVVCDGNRAAFQFASRLASDDATENLLYIHGPEGSGKTHLLKAVAQALGGREGLEETPYFSFRQIDDLYAGEFVAETASRLAERFRGAPALLVDDLHLIPDEESVRVELWQVFNDFYTSGRKIVITGLYPPKDLPAIDDHLVSRLLWGLVAKLDVSDDDSRRMIMKKLAEDRQFVLPADVIDFLLLRIPRDIPSLLAALRLLERHALASGRKVSVKLAKEALQL
ncbi:MAG: AAA family ATPase [Geobacter sp.]|nr:AAA family ATPase [Geobacter sp.]